MPEIVYVLTNESMEGMVKIGRTKNIEKRIKFLDNTSVPLPFQCFYAAEVKNAALVEGKLHRIFVDKRIRTNREFFRVDANQVREAIQLAEIKDVTPKADIFVEKSDVEALQKAVVAEERRAKIRLTELGIPIGTDLTFARDPQIICKIVSEGRVEYEGQEMSPSAAALLAHRKLGYNWSSVNGNSYWKYEDETLAARRLRLEEQQ